MFIQSYLRDFEGSPFLSGEGQSAREALRQELDGEDRDAFDAVMARVREAIMTLPAEERSRVRPFSLVKLTATGLSFEAAPAIIRSDDGITRLATPRITEFADGHIRFGEKAKAKHKGGEHPDIHCADCAAYRPMREYPDGTAFGQCRRVSEIVVVDPENWCLQGIPRLGAQA